MTRTFLPALFASITLVVACGGEETLEPSDFGCSFDEDCLSNEICTLGQCLVQDLDEGPEGQGPDFRDPGETGDGDGDVTDPDPDPNYNASGEEVTPPRLFVEIAWSALADVDLHVLRGQTEVCDSVDACFYGTQCSTDYFGHLEWDGESGETPGDPILAPTVGNVQGTETFTLDLPNADDDRYQIIASVWSADAAVTGPIQVQIRVLLDDEVVMLDSKSLGGAGDNRQMAVLRFDEVLGSTQLMASPGSNASPFAAAPCLSYVYD